MTTTRQLIDLLTTYPPDTQVLLHPDEGDGHNDLGAVEVVRIERDAKAGQAHADGNHDPAPLEDTIVITRSSAGRLRGSPAGGASDGTMPAGRALLALGDDSPIFGEVKAILARQGYETEGSASNARSLIQIASRRLPDIVLLRADLPGFSDATIPALTELGVTPLLIVDADEPPSWGAPPARIQEARND